MTKYLITLLQTNKSMLVCVHIKHKELLHESSTNESYKILFQPNDNLLYSSCLHTCHRLYQFCFQKLIPSCIYICVCVCMYVYTNRENGLESHLGSGRETFTMNTGEKNNLQRHTTMSTHFMVSS